jgi:TolB-like protein/tetratricopeptide (TPR) repeat protein
MSATTIALLPFENLSGDPSQDVIARGLSLDLAVELARFATLEVIPPAPASQLLTLAGSGRAAAPMFVLNGGVRRQQDRMRMSVSLTDTATGAQVWADRYDAAATELLGVQDAIVAQVAATLAIHTDEVRLAVARRKPLVSLEAYECWLRGRECLQRGTVEADDEARRFFERALELDPLFARAHAGLSLSHFNEWSCQAWAHWDEKERLAFMHAERAAALDSTDAMLELVLGRIVLYRRRFDEAALHVDRALALNPNDPDVLAHAALCRAYLGDAASGYELATRAGRHNPISGDWYVLPAALSLFLLGRDEDALGYAVRKPEATVDGPALLAAICAYLGDEARAADYLRWFLTIFQERILFGREPEPGEPLRWVLHVNPFRRAEDVERVTTGLRLAGLANDPDYERPSLRVASSEAAGQPAGEFRRDGSNWTLLFDGVSVQISDAKGLHDLVALLARPHEEQHCLELAGRPAELGGTDDMLDARARREYRVRIQDLQQEIDEAERNHDAARGSRAREEMDALVEALSGALGLGGRSRGLGSASERARSAVTWRIRSAIRKVAAVHPPLGRHLENSVRTGTYCAYTPERPVSWTV